MTSGLRGPGLFREIGTTGLKQYGGNIDEDYDRMFKPLSRKIKTYKEMGDDPIVAAVLQAVKMLIRRVSWYVQPGGEEKADQEAAYFLEQCVDDMSLSWMDAIEQALGMIQYGFSVAELVFKKRNGQRRDMSSKYDDGRIGWRKWLYLGQDSLAPGSPWTFDDSGGLQAVNQVGVSIPIDKALLLGSMF